MIQLSIESFRELYRLNSTIRYNTWQKINYETVSSHSFFVVLFTKMICDTLCVNKDIKLIALEYALVHDTPESLMNDITYDAKKLIPGINKPLEQFEKQYFAKNFPDELKTAFPVKGSRYYEFAKLIVQLADVYSVIQYCDNEVLLGNSRFVQLLSDSNERAVKICEEIERRYKLKCQRIIH